MWLETFNYLYYVLVNKFMEINSSYFGIPNIDCKHSYNNCFWVNLIKLVYTISACKQLSRSVQGIFGPSDPLLGAHIQSICEALDVPHLEARVDFEPTFKEFSINLYPSQDHLNKAFKDLMSFLNWTRVAIIYEEDYGKYLIFYIYFIILLMRCLVKNFPFPWKNLRITLDYRLNCSTRSKIAITMFHLRMAIASSLLVPNLFVHTIFV